MKVLLLLLVSMTAQAQDGYDSDMDWRMFRLEQEQQQLEMDVQMLHYRNQTYRILLQQRRDMELMEERDSYDRWNDEPTGLEREGVEAE